MGGNAFSATLPASAFPRIPPAAYHALKARLTSRLQTLYSVVSTPVEAPEKADHGDLDFVVCEPLTGGTTEVPHADVQALFAAKHVVPMPGNRTSSYAVLIEKGEWAAAGHPSNEEAARQAAEADKQEIYYQVDVHVCADKAEWDRIQFFHGYGDLGMILGLIARNKGLTLGTKGLKLPNPPRAPLDLSESMDEIMHYMGLSMERWNAGFETKLQIFEWVRTSSFFDPTTFKTQGQGIKKVKPERKMYAQFVEWAKDQKQPISVSEDAQEARRLADKEAQIQHALVYFGKKEEFDALAREDAQRVRLKEGFNGTKVRAWTGLPVEQWKDLKLIIDEVRCRLGGEAGILKILEEQGDSEEVLKNTVLRAKEKLGIVAESTQHGTEEVTKLLGAVEITKDGSLQLSTNDS